MEYHPFGISVPSPSLNLNKAAKTKPDGTQKKQALSISKRYYWLPAITNDWIRKTMPIAPTTILANQKDRRRVMPCHQGGHCREAG
jgi:hypothetical protein